jgi:hypothetical protein
MSQNKRTGKFSPIGLLLLQAVPVIVAWLYRRTSISGTTFSGEKCISGTIFHAIPLNFFMLFDNLQQEKVSNREGYLCFFCLAYRSVAEVIYSALAQIGSCPATGMVYGV